MWGEFRHILSKVLFSTNAVYKTWLLKPILNRFSNSHRWKDEVTCGPEHVGMWSHLRCFQSVSDMYSEWTTCYPSTQKAYWHSLKGWGRIDEWHQAGLNLESCKPLSSTLIFHLVHKIASFDHCVILVKVGDVIEDQLPALVWNLLLLFWCPAMIHDDQLHVHVERRLTRKTHFNYFCLSLGSVRMVRYRGYNTSR